MKRITKSLGCLNSFSFISRSKNSHTWLERQKRDPFVEKARLENYRCRSAFKLLEIDERFKLFRAGQYVVDVGAAPGSWTQVLVRKVNSDGKAQKKPVGQVISIDKLPIYEIEGATILPGMDFSKPASQEYILGILKGKKVDFVVSDMAPNATGVKELDHDVIFTLSLSVLRFAVLTSNQKGGCLIKLWDGGKTSALHLEMSRFYNSVKQVKPSSSRDDSAEIYLLARDFKGLKT